MELHSFLSLSKFITLLLYTFFILMLIKKVLGQDLCYLQPTKPPRKIIGYYPAYKLNLRPGIDFNISPSIDYLNYIAFGPNDLVNNGSNLNNPFILLAYQNDRIDELKTYKKNNKLKFEIILSVLLPTDGNNLTRLFNVSASGSRSGGQGAQLATNLVSAANQFGFDGIDIDYPFKLPCYPLLGGFNSAYSDLLNGLSLQLRNKSLMITAGQYPINLNNTNFNNIGVDFINIQAFNLNVNSTTTSAGIDKILQIFNSWNTVVTDKSRLILGVEFGGIIEIVSPSKDIKSDIESQHIQIANVSNSKFPMTDEPIPDQCQYSSYAYLSWNTLKQVLSSSSCPTNQTPTSSSQWKYGFAKNAKQPYLYQQQTSSSNYFVVFYEDYQSLNAKLDYINNNGLAGISIADITKDSNDSQLMNFIASGTQPTSASVRPSTSSTSPSTSPSSNNTGAIVGGVIGSLIFVGAIAGVGFMLYQKRKLKMSDLLKDTKNQTCSDINRQDYSDINREIRSDTHNRIYSDTNHQSS
ncbi:glycoside hydrolase family 18 protein [Gigaspora margarita]|uniref:Glycoside hydrolase family 18 protein n=1 Tax=Gigaspora margarita TaxID=4874 RepID=A0A8H4EPS7_GIGMA|nr:glycoside hydrolase family 18 protein [Gigaspora margarita]